MPVKNMPFESYIGYKIAVFARIILWIVVCFYASTFLFFLLSLFFSPFALMTGGGSGLLGGLVLILFFITAIGNEIVEVLLPTFDFIKKIILGSGIIIDFDVLVAPLIVIIGLFSLIKIQRGAVNYIYIWYALVAFMLYSLVFDFLAASHFGDGLIFAWQLVINFFILFSVYILHIYSLRGGGKLL